MPIIEMPIIWIVVADAAAWVFFHLLISWCTARIPSRWFVCHSRLFQSYVADNFSDKKMKHHIPDGAMFIKKGYNKQALHGNDGSSLAEFAIESSRAELTHWLSMVPAPLFLFWNPVWAFWINAAYAVLFNVPIIIAQRYNRLRLERLIIQKEKKTGIVSKLKRCL